MLKIWKMAAEFRNVYRYNASLCPSVVLVDASEHNGNPASENELRFVVGTCVFLLLAWFAIPACFCLSYIVGKNVDADCWFSWTKCGCCSSQKKKLSPSSPKKKQFSKPSDKTSSTTGSSATIFLAVTWHVPRSRPTGIWKFRSNDTAQSISFP